MKKVILLILDGFGINNNEYGNAIKKANTPVLDKLMTVFPCTELEASGTEVGLPKGQMGNSEVGHMTIGSGRINPQPLTYINEKIKTKEFFDNEVLDEMVDYVKEKGSTLHLIGLLSNGGVHSSANHFYAALALAKLKKVKRVCFHFITDGRDTSPTSGANFVSDFMERARKLNLGELATISGRYYTMDRDNRWERIKKAYDAICYGIGNEFPGYESCFNEHYKREITDEFINPSIITKGKEIKNDDAILFINFRPERMRELIETFTNKSFKMFQTKQFENLRLYSLFNIHEDVKYAFDTEKPLSTFGEYIDGLDFTQARIAETEKYAHVTYFFDGMKEINSKKIEKILIPSPQVPTYDTKPEMSIGEVTETVLSTLENDYDFVLINFANPDMVGHTGNFEATKTAIEICDFCLGKIFEKAKEHFYELIITADHGNAEKMLTKEGEKVTSHTTSKVPFIICNTDYKLKNEGSLKDIVPTIIDIYQIKKPDKMTGESLIIKEEKI
jgi:2,3-bisphosphoglycerate-independent phosphoglycerate mutase